jgi:hypothetical protein
MGSGRRDACLTLDNRTTYWTSVKLIHVQKKRPQVILPQPIHALLARRRERQSNADGGGGLAHV